MDIKLENADFENQEILGFGNETVFDALTQDRVDSLLEANEQQVDETDPNYQKMKEILEKQKKAAEELVRSGHLTDPEWIKEHIAVITDKEILKNEVYQWLNSYVQTPQGQENLAYALVNEAGGGDDKFEIELGSERKLHGAAGWASWWNSHIQLGEESWQNDKKQNQNETAPHEIRHLGQQFIPNLSPRELFLYYSLVIEADARLTEYVDGLAEGRNKEHKGYRGLENDFKAVVKELNDPQIRSWQDFEKLDKNDPKYQTIMGLLKEREFNEVLNHLGKTPTYQNQGRLPFWYRGKGNLKGLQAWIEQMCKRTNMRFDHVWPEVEAMATGRKEIPGMKGAFDEKGQLTKQGKQIIRNASNNKGLFCGEVSYHTNGKVKQEEKAYLDGTKTISWYNDKGYMVRRVDENADGEITESCLYDYDTKGNVTREIWKIADEETIEYIYDAKGYVTREICTNVQGQITQSCEYLHDAKGNTTKKINKNAQGKMTSVCEYAYDAAGHRTSEVTTDANGKVLGSFEYVYDTEGHMTDMIHKDANGNRMNGFEPKLDNAKKQQEEAENSTIAPQAKNDNPRQLGNGKGIDDKLAQTQSEKHRQLGNGQGIDDKLEAVQNKNRQTVSNQKRLINTKEFMNT